MQNNLFLFLSLFLLAACNTPSSTTSTEKPNPTDNPTKSCFTTAIVKDMRNLDGCSFLLELDNGEKLLPIEVKDKDFKFENNQIVEIGYKEEKDAMTTCMAESKAVIITCIKFVDLTGGVRPIPEKVPCEKLNAPFDRNWMKEHVIRLKPKQIDRYDYLDGWAYHLTDNTVEYIYDCQGNLLCNGKKSEDNKCKSYLTRMSEKFTIWVVNN